MIRTIEESNRIMDIIDADGYGEEFLQRTADGYKEAYEDGEYFGYEELVEALDNGLDLIRAEATELLFRNKIGIPLHGLCRGESKKYKNNLYMANAMIMTYGATNMKKALEEL